MITVKIKDSDLSEKRDPQSYIRHILRTSGIPVRITYDVFDLELRIETGKLTKFVNNYDDTLVFKWEP